MSSYLRLVDGLSGVAETMLAGIQVYNGTLDQINQDVLASGNADLPMIGIQEGFAMTQREVDDQVKEGRIVIDFGLQDTPDSKPQHTRNIVASLDILIDQFLDQVLNVYGLYDLQVMNIERRPFYKRMDCISGMMLQFDYRIGQCGPNVFPDLSEFMNEISKNVSPYDWQGITQRI